MYCVGENVGVRRCILLHSSAALLHSSATLLLCYSAALLHSSATLLLCCTPLLLYCSAALLCYSTALLHSSAALLHSSATLLLCCCSATRLPRSHKGPIYHRIGILCKVKSCNFDNHRHSAIFNFAIFLTSNIVWVSDMKYSAIFIYAIFFKIA